MGFHVCDDLAHPPGRETSAYDLCFCVGTQTDATRTEARYSAKEGDCMRNVRSYRFAVTITSSACSFGELHSNERQLLCRRFVRPRVCIGIHFLMLDATRAIDSSEEAVSKIIARPSRD
jgi:hypothetical protein